MIDELFNSYFCNAIDIGDHDALCDIACKVEIDLEMVARLLNGNSDIALIKEKGSHSQKMGVTAVQTFIIANQNVVSGSQTSEFWGRIINELQEHSESYLLRFNSCATSEARSFAIVNAPLILSAVSVQSRRTTNLLSRILANPR